MSVGTAANRFRLLASLAVLGLLTATTAGTSHAGVGAGGFADVRGNEYYGAAVAWMMSEGITTGVGGTDRYEPRQPLTRAQVAAFLWRFAGRPCCYPDHGFTDVPSASYFDAPVRWLRAEGLTTGVGGTDRYEPHRTLIRAEMGTFLWRFEGEPRGHPPHGFTDVPSDSYYEEPVRWLRDSGLTTGVGGSNRFEPHRDTTRGEVAAFFWRYAGRPAPPNPGNARSCGDFVSQPEAQGWYDLYHRYYGDVGGLDRSGDGVACPELPGDPQFPVLTADEFRRFQIALEPLPATQAIVSPPGITGHGDADARIRWIAGSRGYRLQSTPGAGLESLEGEPTHARVAGDLRALLSEVRNRGMTIGVTSVYRSVDRQRTIFGNRLDQEGRSRIGRPYTGGEIAAGQADAAIDSVLRFHSIPGYSKHHSGRAVDFHAGGSLAQFEGSPAERWLRAYNFHHAKRFGFVPSYPRDAQQQGPEPEPWEYVHVGQAHIRCAYWYLDLEDDTGRAACPAGRPFR